MVEREEVKCTSPYKCIKNASTNGRILTEHWLNISRGPRHQKGQERPRHNQVGWKKEKERKRDGNGTTGGGGEGEKRFPQGRQPPHSGEISGTEWEHWELSEASTTTGECGRTGWDLYSWSVPQPKMCVLWYRWGLGSESWVWKANPERGLLWATKRQPEGIGVRKPITLNACGGNPDSTEAKRHCWVMCKGQPLNHAQASASLRIRETPSRADFHKSMATGQSTSFQFRVALLWTQLQTSPPLWPYGHHRILFTLSPA